MMFLFYVVVSIKGETVLCLNENEYKSVKNPNKPKDDSFSREQFCRVVFDFSIWIQAENIKQTGEIGKLYQELIDFIRSHPEEEGGIKNKIDEYVAANLKHLGLGESGPCASYDDAMHNVLIYLKRMHSLKISLPSEPCKKKDFCDLEPDDIYFYVFEFNINSLLDATVSDHVNKNPKPLIAEYFKKRDSTQLTKADSLLGVAYKDVVHTDLFTNQYFYLFDLLHGEDNSNNFRIDYTKNVQSHHIIYYLKGNTSWYMSLFTTYFGIRQKGDAIDGKKIGELPLEKILELCILNESARARVLKFSNRISGVKTTDIYFLNYPNLLSRKTIDYLFAKEFSKKMQQIVKIY